MAARKYTIALGTKAKDVTQAAGDAVGTDTVLVNLDCTNMTKGQAVLLIEQVREVILEGPWPPA